MESLFVGEKNRNRRSLRKLGICQLDVTVYHSTGGNSHATILCDASVRAILAKLGSPRAGRYFETEVALTPIHCDRGMPTDTSG